MVLQDQLKQLGLNHSEIVVYLFLLENGLSTPPIVSHGTKIARTNCYNILKELKNKDLVTEQAAGKRKAYLAHDPESLLHGLERKREIISQILPDLRGLFTTQKNKPKIRFFDGIEQVRQIYLASLEAKQIYGFTSMNQFLDVFKKPGLDYLTELAKRKIFFNDVLSHTSRAYGAPEMKKILGGLYTYHFLPPEYKEFPTDMIIWDDNIALLTLNEPVFGTILTNKTMANTFKIIHQVMWNATN
ncbi:MAG: helix-turn-helix domain-containing protein [Candidatus Magasanikbacteria bacterium]|nr:helix-turn-helix domain-containing protein [Candidatus Magasanikbacteria bacterium]